MPGGGRGEARQGQRPRQQVVAVAAEHRVFHQRRDQDRAVRGDREVLGQAPGERGDPEAAIALAGDHLGRQPALVAGQIEPDELAEAVEIALHAPIVAGLALFRRLLVALGAGFRHDAVAGADRIDEDEVSEGEPGVRVVAQADRRGRPGAVGVEREPARPDPAEMKEYARRPGAAIEQEGERPPPARGVIAGVGDVEDHRLWLVRRRPDPQRADLCGVGEPPARQRHAVGGRDRLRDLERRNPAFGRGRALGIVRQPGSGDCSGKRAGQRDPSEGQATRHRPAGSPGRGRGHGSSSLSQYRKSRQLWCRKLGGKPRPRSCS